MSRKRGEEERGERKKGRERKKEERSIGKIITEDVRS